LFAAFHNLFAAALHNRLFFAELSPFSALRPLENSPFLIPNPTLSYTFLRFGIHLKSARGETFLHFPTLPTLPMLCIVPVFVCIFCKRIPRQNKDNTPPSPYQGRTFLAPSLPLGCTNLA